MPTVEDALGSGDLIGGRCCVDLRCEITTAAVAPMRLAAYATSGVGAGSAKKRTGMPAATSTPIASSAKDLLESRPS